MLRWMVATDGSSLSLNSSLARVHATMLPSAADRGVVSRFAELERRGVQFSGEQGSLKEIHQIIGGTLPLLLCHQRRCPTEAHVVTIQG